MMKFVKYGSGIISIEIQSMIPERFINLLWKNDIHIKNISRIDITTMRMEISIRDYDKISQICKKTNTHIRIIGRKGLFFYLFRIKRQASLVGGALIFGILIFYLSTYMWSIDIETDKYLSPYEVRQKLYSYGIKPGMPKSKIDVRSLEEKMLKDNTNIMFFKARMEGSTLKINVVESYEPPTIIKDTDPCDVVAKADGQVLQIFSTAGTPVVKAGDTVKKGQVLIKGEQGKEASVYPVHAKGSVMAKTFCEYEREMQIKGVTYKLTGREIENTYITVMGKKIYLKKSLNRFDSYDKIIDNEGFVKREIYRETKASDFNLDEEQVVQSTVDDLYKKTEESFDKSAKIVDKLVDKERSGDNIKIRVVFVVEMDIASEQKVQQ